MYFAKGFEIFIYIQRKTLVLLISFVYVFFGKGEVIKRVRVYQRIRVSDSVYIPYV